MHEVAVTGGRRPRIAGLYRLQWEEVQQAHVLLFPEGMIRLNRSAGEILIRCDGQRTVDDLVADLERAFGVAPLGADIRAFLGIATDNRWVEWRNA